MRGKLLKYLGMPYSLVNISFKYLVITLRIESNWSWSISRHP